LALIGLPRDKRAFWALGLRMVARFKAAFAVHLLVIYGHMESSSLFENGEELFFEILQIVLNMP